MMMRLLFMVFLLIFQIIHGLSTTTSSKFKKLKLPNGINVILLENFRMPTILIGIIFDVGSFDAPLNKNNITQIIAENIINSKTHERFNNLGISHSTNVSGECTEIFSHMNPARLEEFLAIICSNISEISVENLEVLKKQMTINGKLARRNPDVILSNVIFANVDVKNANTVGQIFNEKSLNSISEEDVKRFFESRYKDCHLAVVVVGAVDKRKLMKALKATIGQLGHRKEMSVNVWKNRCFRDILIKNKYMHRGFWYFYHIPRTGGVVADKFLQIVDRQLFDFFHKNNQLVHDYSIHELLNKGDRLLVIGLQPKMDVTMEKLQMAHEVFVNRMCRMAISEERLSKIALLSDQKRQFVGSDLLKIYAEAKNVLLRGESLNSIGWIDGNVKNLKGEDVKVLAKKIFADGLAFKIATRYKSDR